VLEYWVIFLAPDNKATKWMLDNKFGHCVIMKIQDSGLIRIEPTHGRLKVDFIDIDAPLDFSECAALRIKVKSLVSKNNFLNWIIMHLPHRVDCVSQTMYCLGLHGFTLTPKQLYNRLLRKRFFNIVECEDILR